jgi:hypothetical protein
MSPANPRRSPATVCRKVAEETFLVPVRGRLAEMQNLFVLNRVGEWIWSRLDGDASPDELVRAMVGQFEVDAATATADLEEFLAGLGEGGLLAEETR